ncbi:arylamine N-acetyltransferase [Siminovitchia sp. FSL H7-0308]|uniref:N-hydroxyarylamine O-acetyltransferase n=1 Tax=Siminovitchia thermophila TaxID=1245522 RepID=A0ABS2R0Q5_9BACI|nr:arylamine N-acetyltransferase [Siminovitchia thermophila]MBM7713217.1 N-hydroxyarylamine O-acetyltransferase [Siminovitchia thermophila]ONK22093.1 hypothetical protein BLX87_19605 [Bacillus sp. VT-16-64]
MELFIRKIYESGYPEDKPPKDRVTFILQKFAEWFPFENTDVMNHNIDPVTPAFLIKKMVTASRGGLCYEINPLLYLVLKELGFQPTLAAATVKNKDEWVLDGTHALVLLEIDHEKYIADSGFGNRLALAPLQLDGPEVISPAGAFRLRSVSTEKGAVVMEHSADHKEWSICYAFDWAPVTWESLNRMKKTIHEHPRSPFNKELLIASVLEDGTISINEKRQHKKWMDGREDTIYLENEQCLLDKIRAQFHPSLVKEVEKYKLK